MPKLECLKKIDLVYIETETKPRWIRRFFIAITVLNIY